MSLVLAFDSFKDCMSSQQAADCFARGYHRISPNTPIKHLSLSDGGEGFLKAMLQDGTGRTFTRKVCGPLAQPCRAAFGMRPGKVAIVEMAAATGLEQVPPAKRNPLNTTSYGTGELIAAALKKGATTIILGVGGSATVDGGIGMAQALGVRFYSKQGRLIRRKLRGKDLLEIGRMECDDLLPAFCKATIIVACDVTNPLCGKDGAARVFGPQKGATAAMVGLLEKGLDALGTLLEVHCGRPIKTLPGSGAAGGITAMLAAIGRTTLKEGAPLVLEAAGFAEHLKQAELVVTGEGSIDSQTAKGKAVMGVITMAAAAHVPVIAIGGRVIERDLDPLYRRGLSAAFCLANEAVTLDDAIRRGPEWMRDMGATVARFRASVSSSR